MDWKDSLNLPVSAQGEWAAKRFYGDPKLAAAYLPVAYALLGEVKNRMAYGGVSYGHRAIELPDGTRIRVIRNGEQNILEIETVPVVGREILPGTPGSGGMIFYPRTEAAPLGIYTPTGPAARHPVPGDQRPFATLSYRYNEEDEKFDLSATAPANMQSGNQFFIDENGSVYSWWHSPCGDGPVISHVHVDTVLSEYSPFFIHERGTLYYKGADGETYIHAKVLYKDGGVWLNLDISWIIAGFWTGEVEVEPDVFETRYVIALYVAVKLSFLVFKQDDDTLVKVPSVPSEFQWQNKWVKNSSSWPVRFNKTGSEASVIIANSTDPDAYSAGLFDHLNVCTVSITHAKNSVTLGKSEVLHFLGDRISTSTFKEYKKTTVSTVSSGPVTNTVRNSEWEFGTRLKITFAQGATDIPIALNYGSDGGLNFIYVRTNPSPAEGGGGNIGYFKTIVHNFTWNPGRGLDSDIESDWATEYRAEGYSSQSYFSHIKTAAGILYQFNTTATRASGRSATAENERRVRIAKGLSQAGTTTSEYYNIREAERPDQSNPTDNDIRLLYINVIKSEIVTANYVRGLANPGAMSQTHRISSGTNPGYYEEINEISGYVDSLRHIGVVVAVRNLSGAEELVSVREEQRKTTVFTEDDPNVDEFRSVSNISYDALSGARWTGDSDVNAVTTEEAPVYVNVLLTLFDNSPPIHHSYVEDHRVSEKLVWARSLQVKDTLSGNPSVVVSESQTDSTFGPLTQHVFLLDAEGVITGQPVNDPTLTIHPIGLF